METIIFLLHILIIEVETFLKYCLFVSFTQIIIEILNFKVNISYVTYSFSVIQCTPRVDYSVGLCTYIAAYRL